MVHISQIPFGRIAKIHGNDGSVSVKLEKVFIENIPQMESVYIEIDGKQVPFFISSLIYTGGDIIRLKFEGYTTYEKLSEFNGCLVSLTSVPKGYNNPETDKDLTGFSVLLPSKSVVGTVTRIIQNPGQDLLSVIKPDGREILIPFHEHFIIKLDLNRKRIIMDLPEGLEEIN